MIAETEDDLIKKLNEWKDNMQNRGIRVNMNKTKNLGTTAKQAAIVWACAAKRRQ